MTRRNFRDMAKGMTNKIKHKSPSTMTFFPIPKFVLVNSES